MTYSLAGFFAIIIHLIINSNLLFNKHWVLLPEEQNYKLFLLSVIAFHVTDALWGILYEHQFLTLVFIDTELYFIAMAISILLWTKFVLNYLGGNNKFSTIINYTGILFFLLQIIFIFANIYTPVFFYFDENNEYHASYLRFVSIIAQNAIYLATSIYSLFIATKNNGQAKRRYRTTLFFGLIMIAAITIQYIYPLIPLYTFGYLIGGCALHTFVLEDAKAEYRAKHDNLTGLPNNLYLSEKLSKIIDSAKKKKLSVGLLYINIDNFKSVNNCYGYKQGDMVLCMVAQRLRDLVSEQYLARSSADNFLVIITAPNRDLIIKQANSIQNALNEPFAMQGYSTLYVGTSLGLVILEADSDKKTNLLHCAELAMFDAKKHGGNAISIFDERMRTTAFDRKQLENALHEAIKNDGFLVYYQPKIDISKNDAAGCEALVRWQLNGKWISPGDFIPIAEETGLVTPIDMFVLRSACRQALKWKNDVIGDIPVAVNMSAHSILSAGFADQVIRILEQEGTPPSLIDIEITETSFMSDIETAFAAISRLHEYGIRIALDDFGTGYSSLQYLSAMPISFLKIDRKFVIDIFSGKVTAKPLVKSILSLAASLGMKTVSEGVEDTNQLAFLAGNGADIIQGYLFSKPLAPADCEEYLRNRKARITAITNDAFCRLHETRTALAS